MEYQYLDQTQGSVEMLIQLPAAPSCFPVAGSDGKGTSVVIENWNEISEKEQEVSWRRISKRKKSGERCCWRRCNKILVMEGGLLCYNQRLIFNLLLVVLGVVDCGL
jgi:hypothetical protein